MNADMSSIMCYLGDTGLFVSQTGDESAPRAQESHRWMDKIELNEGMRVENVVAQMPRAAGYAPYFCSCADRTVRDNRMEVDFRVDKPIMTW